MSERIVIDQDVITAAVARQRKGLSVDRLIRKAVGTEGRLFDRLRRYKAYADAICKAMRHGVEQFSCDCGAVFPSYRERHIHRMSWCPEREPSAIDPRVERAVAQYEAGEKVMVIVKELGISTSTLYKWINRAGVSADRQERKGAA